jgi:membrane protein implicated in regulation of membrane protease activity
VRPRVYLIVWGAAMMAVAVVVLVLNQDTSTELLGSVAFVGGLAVVVNAILDLTGNGKQNHK